MSKAEHNPAENSINSRNGKVRSFLALGTVVGIGAVVTLAQFTDSGDVAAEFSTGSVNIQFDGDNDGDPEPYAFTALSIENAGPGDQTIAAIEINNNGSLDFDYTMDTTIEPLDGDQAEADALAAELELAIVGVATAGDCDAGAFDAPTDPVYGPAPLPGGEIGEPGRFLETADSEFLCYSVTFGDDVPQGTGAIAVFGFLATQSG
ncbi:hypothetical protein [Phytoactinopolyspora mesophila]|uniref:SipW-cognate class signal peptide n=1 Tax=Phytoactinopolyspora mesophila TaxID=2650750 RepID=A0A7K3LWV7_9ACTN|nr:hypothetical protein [Phytoactinopolyspora mesophila]NDL55496.1 hypothetical protein [Phytoactinopolyspora mesophila]